ncbi:transporter substrate-binding domain-containing protein [Pseudodesulfovibrio sp. zrk46]|uniref:transporter substrate-binding domain-containing protein n=1 Tax=Pseudodesulfovibrio sp. zrk46 TaxID=2725288 RepID=UPI0014493D19|nr:transporter substrate-binding domain-containing protein [Pseudodesulfovibrio sp. zrk46]QJB55303.1 transporter substrate-binding domain-containing protein [Pseudodesulfovibrio sp. zrk46]
MRKAQRTTLLIVLMAWTFVLLCGGIACGEPAKIRVGVFQNAPIIFQDKLGAPEGLYIDLLNAIAASEEWELVYVLDSWGEILRRTTRGQLDLIPSIAYTQKRAADLDFSKEKVLTMWGQVYANENESIQTFLDLGGKRVAILFEGINGINFKKKCAEFGISCTFVEKQSYDEIMTAVEAGEVEAGVLNNVKGYTLEKRYEVIRTPIIFDPFSILFAATKGKSEILNTIDSYLIKWKKDKDSEYYKAVDHWIKGGASDTDGIPHLDFVTFTILILMGSVLLFYFVERRKRKK